MGKWFPRHNPLYFLHDSTALLRGCPNLGTPLFLKEMKSRKHYWPFAQKGFTKSQKCVSPLAPVYGPG